MSGCLCCRVEGRVQGVWFRASTREQAGRLGLTGHARNLPDGAVEVLACGDPAALDQLHRWLHHGPPLARVDRLDCAPADSPPPAAFTTG
ncbi:acylphosphatase [Endothiovibrio diazotrophicus]